MAKVHARYVGKPDKAIECQVRDFGTNRLPVAPFSPVSWYGVPEDVPGKSGYYFAEIDVPYLVEGEVYTIVFREEKTEEILCPYDILIQKASDKPSRVVRLESLPDPVPLPTQPDPRIAPRVVNSGFERPALPPRSFVEKSPEGWEFLSGSQADSGARFSSAGSRWTIDNPPPPEGSQVAVIKMDGGFRQSVPNWEAGRYVVSFLAARRKWSGSPHDFRVLIDGKAVGEFVSSILDFIEMRTRPFYVDAGTHVLEFRGINSRSEDGKVDNSTFFDDIRILPVA